MRLGVYLQDHSKHSKGLCLRTESHLNQKLNKGKIINVKSEIGDVVIWKLTTTHSANADVISLFPNYSFHPRIARRFPNFLKQKYRKPRIAMFMCFGKQDNYSKEYIEYLKTRKYAVEKWINSDYSKEVLSQMKSQNVTVNINLKTLKMDSNKLNKDFKQI